MKSYQDAIALAQAIKNRELTPRDAVEYSFAKIKKENDNFQAVITLFEEEALAEAERMTNFNRPFSGVPILIKDAGQDLAGQPSTLGSFLLRDNIAKETSNFVTMLQNLGFIIIGQSNVPEFSLKFVSDSKLFGPVKNPINPSYHAGGSSGGAATAVQRGLVPIAAASDGGGSIRIPASFSGLVGLKPTRGKIITGPGSYRSWAGASINFALSRSVRDTRLLLHHLQVEGIESMPFQAPKVNFFDERPFDIQKIKFAYSFEVDPAYPPSPEAVQALQQTVDFLKSLGCTVEEAYPTYDYKKILRCYYQMNGAEQIKSFLSIEQGLGRPIQRGEVEETTWLLAEYGKRIPASLYSESLDDWDRLSHIFGDFHEDYDVLIQPTTAKTAPHIKDPLFDVERLQQIDSYDSLSTEDLEDLVLESFQAGTLASPYAFIQNLTGQPALSLPLYTSSEGLPLGVMFSARKNSDRLLLDIGDFFESQGLLEDYSHVR